MKEEKKKNRISVKETEVQGPSKSEKEEDIFAVEEIIMEEMAIDGICGVY